MKLKIITYGLVLLILFTNAFAQSKTDSTSSNIFQKHSMQFRVSSYLSLSSFKGTLISYKYHFSDYHAFRLGVSLSSQNSDFDENRDIFESDTSNYEKILTKTYYDFYVVGEYLYYLNPSNDVKLFIGIGPLVKIYKSSHKTDKIFYSDTSASYSYDKERFRTINEFGISSVYGVEWFFRTNMSLHAEYSFSFSYYVKNENKHHVTKSRFYANEGITKYNYDDKGFIFKSNAVRFGLSVYF